MLTSEEERLQKNNKILEKRLKWPLDKKIDHTINTMESWSADGAYISFSGGLGSRVLVDLYLKNKISISPMPIVFVDTGLEYPSVREMALKYATIVLKPEMTFKQVLEKYGYPVVSKSQSLAVYKLRHYNLSEKYRNKLLYGDEKGTAGKLSEKWKILLDAPFEVSNMCCDVIKKKPFHKFDKETGLKPMTAEMVGESRNRRDLYVKHGCQMHDLEHPKCVPMAFWTDQDLLTYVKKYEIDYAEEYGEIECPRGGKCFTSGEDRTGCMFCLYGIQFEPPWDNRFTRMAKNHPKIYDYCINKLGLGEVMDYMGINYKPYPEQLTLF